MTPTELEEYARQQYNAVGDTFYSQSELLRHMFAAQMELATEAKIIRRVYTASTVASTQEYAKPSNSHSIKRITYDNVKLAPITMVEDDALKFGSTSTITGTPAYYYEWGDSIFLEPTPAAVGTLKIYSYDMPQTVTATSTLDAPERYHHGISIYLLWQMAFKDKNFQMADRYEGRWKAFVMKAVADERKRQRGDGFVGVQDSETLNETVIGAI